jgi:hypothetical protein
VDYPFSSRHEGPGFNPQGGYLCETGVLLYYEEEHHIWFCLIEAQFAVAGIKSQKPKYANAQPSLPKQVLRDILDTLDVCNESDEPFDFLKTTLLGQCGKSEWQSYFELLRLPMVMQGLKPSVLMGKLKYLPPGVSSDNDPATTAADPVDYEEMAPEQHCCPETQQDSPGTYPARRFLHAWDRRHHHRCHRRGTRPVNGYRHRGWTSDLFSSRLRPELWGALQTPAYSPGDGQTSRVYSNNPVLHLYIGCYVQ